MRCSSSLVRVCLRHSRIVGQSALAAGSAGLGSELLDMSLIGPLSATLLLIPWHVKPSVLMHREAAHLLTAEGTQRTSCFRAVHHQGSSRSVIDGRQARSHGSVEGHLAAIQDQVHALAPLGVRQCPPPPHL